MSQHTPGPCRCTFVKSGDGSEQRIVYCDIHGKAPEMKAALNEFIEESLSILHVNPRGFDSLRIAVAKARALLREIEEEK